MAATTTPAARLATIAQLLAVRGRAVAAIDLDAFDANARLLVDRARGRPLRVASKSLRCAPLIQRALAVRGFSGVLAYSVAEATMLAASGVDDVVVGYPSVDQEAMRAALVHASRITFMVDCVEHVRMVQSIALQEGQVARVAIAAHRCAASVISSPSWTRSRAARTFSWTV
jgi:D-serine deaminase-like pyridoxal phosphate-dependent protein